MGKALGVDWGARRIGLAVSDDTRTIARTLPVVEVHPRRDPTKAVIAVVAENDVDTIVIGNPLHMSGEESETGRRVARFKALLEGALPGIRIVLRDERLTSREAELLLRERGGKPGSGKGRIDQLAAAIILQSYLDEVAL